MSKICNNRGTSFCFTDFNEFNIVNGYEDVYNEYKDLIRGIAWGVEICPKTKRKHNQAYIQLFSQDRFTKIQKWIRSKCHFEVMHGSIESNEDYCSKEGKFTKLGYFCTQGYKTDFHNIKEDLRNGASVDDIMENYTPQYCRYPKGINDIAGMMAKKRANKWRDVEVTALVGPAGSGKSSYVFKKHGYDQVFVVDAGSSDKFLFDGYANEPIVLIDDFNGYIKYTYLLRLLDGHKCPLNIKGGKTYANWSKVYITSNKRPQGWYTNIGKNLKRRIEICLEVSKGNTRALTHEETWTDHVYDSYGENEEINSWDCSDYPV